MLYSSMSLVPIEDGKFRLKITSPEQVFKLPKAFALRAYKFKWVLYNTISAGQTELTINVSELSKNGYFITDTNTFRSYSVSFPMDRAIQVSNLFVNYTDQYDAVYKETRVINQLNFQVLINNLPASDISVSNPLDLELIFYEYL